MRTSPWFWIGFHALLLGVLALDLGVFHRRARAVSAREAAIWTAVWVALALGFAGAIFFLAAIAAGCDLHALRPWCGRR